MSCYEWERGRFTLPERDFGPFRDRLVDAYAATQGQPANPNHLVLPDADLIFYPEDNTVYYYVECSNYACEAARKDPLVQQMFALLDAVEWTEDTGGYVHGSDEYYDDLVAGGFGCTSSFLKETYGPIGALTRLRGLPVSACGDGPPPRF